MKKLLCVFLVVLLACFSVIPAVAFDEGADTTNRYYFLVPDGTNGIRHKDGTYAPSWYTDDAVILFKALLNEGTQTIYPNQSDDDANIYYVDADKGVPLAYWCNGEEPSVSTVNISTEYYDPGESDLYPDGLENFDNMIYVADPNNHVISTQYNLKGEWYYYYGNGCYGVNAYGDVTDCIRDDHTHITVGDVDEDGIVNIFDATEIQLYLAKYTNLTDTQMILADADRDNAVTIFDVTQIQLYLAKIIKEL